MIGNKHWKAAVAAVVALALCGCNLWYKDLKGYVEYWTDTVTVERAIWEANPESQQNSSGVHTIATNATVTASLTISNPEGYPLESIVSSAADGPHAVEVSGAAAGAVLPLTRITSSSATSLAVEIAPFSQVPTPASLALEHTNFTVRISPTRSENAFQAPNSLALTLRYNTPPRMPLAVIQDTNGSFRWPQDGDRWDASSGKIYWAWPADKTAAGGCDLTDPDYVATFYVDDGTPESKAETGWLKQGQTLPGEDGTVYNIYEATGLAQTGTAAVCAADGEGVCSRPATSGELVKITLKATGKDGTGKEVKGTFAYGKDEAEVWRPKGSLLSGGDFDVPTAPSGYYLSGWTRDGNPVSFPLEMDGEMTLVAQWEEDRAWQDGINRKTGEYEKPKQDAFGNYQVANAGNLLWIGKALQDGTITKFDFKLTADIEVPVGQWTPIGLPDLGALNSSVFDGQGHSITLNNAPGGLFSVYNYSTVKNLVLKGSINATGGNVGAVGSSMYASRIENVMSEVAITNAGAGLAGGLVGNFGGEQQGCYSVITNCAVYANVTGNRETGGLIGQLWKGNQPATVRNSVYMGTVSGSPAGAVVGYNRNNSSSSSTLENIFYCESGGIGSIGDNGAGGTMITNVVSKTDTEIASQDAVNLLNTNLQSPQWVLVNGKYPTLKKSNP